MNVFSTHGNVLYKLAPWFPEHKPTSPDLGYNFALLVFEYSWLTHSVQSLTSTNSKVATVPCSGRTPGTIKAHVWQKLNIETWPFATADILARSHVCSDRHS